MKLETSIMKKAVTLSLLCAGLAAPAPGATASAITLQSSSNPSNLSQTVTLTATVSPPTATGKVTFFDGATPLGVAVLSNGKATFATTLLPSGTRSLKALYGGDGTFLASTSASLGQTVSALPQKGFQAAVAVGGLSFPRKIAIADFNGDGIADVAVDDFDIGKMSVLIGNGDGTFRTAVTYTSQSGPTDIVVADFNGDGHPDIAVANGATPSNSVSIFLNKGDGTFQAAVNYSIGDPNTLVNPNNLVVADFNGDGVADIVTSNFSDSTISLLLGNGDGTFRTPVKFNVGVNPTAIAAADFNGDGAADLVLSVNKLLLVLLGNGNGTFQTPVSYPAGANPAYVTVGDLNGDGRPDLIATSGGEDIVNVLLGNGNGTFRPAVSYAAPKNIQSVAVGDFDGDGRADLAVADSASNNVNLLFGNGDGTFQSAVAIGPVSQPLFVAVGDLNHDGRSDLAVANFGPGNGISILLGIAVAPSPLITKVANAEGESLTIAPNTWVEIKGTGLAPTNPRIWQGPDFVNNQLPTALDAVSVMMNGKAAFVYFISPTQINVLTPPDLALGALQVQVTFNGAASPLFTVQSQPLSASFFVFNGGPYVAATHLNGTYIGPTSLFPGLTTPVMPGETIVLYANGFGPTSTATVSGSLVQSGTLSPLPIVKIGGLAANVSFAGLVAVGEYQFNVDVPLALPDGDTSITATYNGSTTQSGTLVTIQH
jgi:uncharacterized protein (TIGR03437 family)